MCVRESVTNGRLSCKHTQRQVVRSPWGMSRGALSGRVHRDHNTVIGSAVIHTVAGDERDERAIVTAWSTSVRTCDFTGQII